MCIVHSVIAHNSFHNMFTVRVFKALWLNNWTRCGHCKHVFIALQVLISLPLIKLSVFCVDFEGLPIDTSLFSGHALMRIVQLNRLVDFITESLEQEGSFYLIP